MLFLKKTYQRFLEYEKKRFLEDSDSWFGVKKTNKKKKEEFFDNYYKISFYRFLSNLKHLVYPEDPFDFIKNGWGDNWEMETYVSFLKKEKIIKVSGNKILIKNKSFFNDIPRPKREKEIKELIERKSGKKIKTEKTVVCFVNEFQKFNIKSDWDQMPFSQSSALFSVERILDYIPLNKKFLFIGDDDFLSVFLSLADNEIESIVIDADKELLDCIDSIASRFKLKIETKLVDTRKKIKIKENFVGFWCNPPYTEKGVQSFIDYGINHLNQNGGNAFLVMSSENIGNRIIFLQKYFSRKNLALMEVVTSRIFYPYLDLHQEDKDNFERMKNHFDENEIRKSARLGADLWVFDQIPFEIKRIESNNSIYSYL